MHHILEYLHTHRKMVTTITWITVGMLVPLTLLTIIVIVLRLGSFAALGADTIFIVPHDAEFSIGDHNGTWETDTNVEIFSLSHQNNAGEVTVLSGNGDTVIAPGSTGIYRFELKNPGNVALQCHMDLGAFFTAEAENSLIQLPFTLRLRNANGHYLIGGEDEWVPYQQIDQADQTLTLGKNSFMIYELEWCWSFEGNNDMIDTFFGSAAATSELLLTLSINTTAQLAEAPDASGDGEVLDPNKEQLTGGENNPLPFILVAGGVIVVLTILILVYISYRKKLGRIGMSYRLSSGRRRR